MVLAAAAASSSATAQPRRPYPSCDLACLPARGLAYSLRVLRPAAQAAWEPRQAKPLRRAATQRPVGGNVAANRTAPGRELYPTRGFTICLFVLAWSARHPERPAGDWARAGGFAATQGSRVPNQAHEPLSCRRSPGRAPASQVHSGQTISMALERNSCEIRTKRRRHMDHSSGELQLPTHPMSGGGGTGG